MRIKKVTYIKCETKFYHSIFFPPFSVTSKISAVTLAFGQILNTNFTYPKKPIVFLMNVLYLISVKCIIEERRHVFNITKVNQCAGASVGMDVNLFMCGWATKCVAKYSWTVRSNWHIAGMYLLMNLWLRHSWKVKLAKIGVIICPWKFQKIYSTSNFVEMIRKI